MSESSNVYRLPVDKMPHRGTAATSSPARPAIHAVTVCAHCGGEEFVERGMGYRGDGPSRLVVAASFCENQSCIGFTQGNQPNARRTVYKHLVRPRFCGPGQRIVLRVTGWWLWRREVRCEELGAHIHHSCPRCGWTGVSLPATENA
jgi:hypothetical protein